MQTAVPFLVAGTRFVYGTTRHGADLEEYQWGNPKRSLLIVSGFSRNDASLTELAVGWWNDLLQRSGADFNGQFNQTELWKRGRLRFIPRFNADAFAPSQNAEQNRDGADPLLERTAENANARGVDPDRNFNADWLSYRAAHPDRIDEGAFPESEAETAAFCARMRKDPPAAAILLKSGKNTLFYSPEATKDERDAACFFARYGDLEPMSAEDDGGTMLRWLTQFGIPAYELCPVPTKDVRKLRELLLICAAGLLS